MADEKEFFFLKNVRISFPSLFKQSKFQGENSGYGAIFLLNKEEHAATIKKIKTHMKALSTEKFDRMLPVDKLCLREGTDKREEYEGCLALSAKNQSQPRVINSKGNGVIANEDESKIYAGCRVNAKISFWAQDNDFGKRINCNLMSVQFNDDDESFDGNYVTDEAAIEGFGAVGGGDDGVDDDEDFLQ